MDDKKRDLIPVAAIAIFLIIIIILCVVRLNARKEETQKNQVPVTESAGQIEESEGQIEGSAEETESVIKKETESSRSAAEETAGTEQEDGQQQEKPTESQMPSGKEKDRNKKKSDQSTKPRTISGNDPFAGADSAGKTNEEMLMEMSAYWEQDNMNAVWDLAHLAWYMKMSASIADENTFYYYGERNAQGQPQGTGIACYADNSYYYGQWSGGKREGQGEWVKYYVYYDDDTTSDRAYRLHMYMGEWADDMPNGDGQEHYDLDLSQAAKKDRYLQNVIGTFKDGLYSGEMYLTTLNWDGNQEEWNGFADEGIWSPYGAATNKKEVPVCQDVDDDSNYLWIEVRRNKERGIDELLP